MSFTEQEMEEFKVEALELLDVAEKSLLALDSGADFKTSFDSVFRGFHNLKGASGMMDLHKLQTHTHELENIWMTFKERAAIPKEFIGMFLSGIDAARALLQGEDINFSYTIAPTATPPVATLSAAVAEPSPEPVIQVPSTEIQNLDSAPTEDVTPLGDSSKTEISQSTLNEFVSECQEIVERVSQNLQAIESGNYTKDSLDALYRDVHSLKGSSYLFSFIKLGDLAHVMESSLENIRVGTHKPSAGLLDGLFKSLKVIDHLIQRINSKKSDEDLASEILEVTFLLVQSAEQLEKMNTPIANHEETTAILPPTSTTQAEI